MKIFKGTTFIFILLGTNQVFSMTEILVKIAIGLLQSKISKLDPLNLVTNKTVILDSDILKGSLVFDLLLQGTKSFEIPTKSAPEKDDKSNDISLTMKTQNINISIPYTLDMAVNNEIPLYGNGNLVLGIESIKANLDLNAKIDLDNPKLITELSKLNLLFEFRSGSISYISGFMNNEYASSLVTSLIRIVEDIFAMWVSYERDCISCVLSPTIENLIHKALEDGTVININCPCLQNKLNRFISRDNIVKAVENAFTDFEKPLSADNKHSLKDMKMLTNKLLLSSNYDQLELGHVFSFLEENFGDYLLNLIQDFIKSASFEDDDKQ